MISIRSSCKYCCILFIVTLSLFFQHEARAVELTSNAQNTIDSIAVMPFLPGGKDAQQAKKLEKTLDCQLLGLCYLEEELQTGAEETMTSVFQRELKKILPHKVVPSGQVMSVFSKMPKNEKNTPRDLAIALGKELRASHVMVGLLWRYKERAGSPLTAESPASVAFSVFLVNVENGRLIWKSSFDKTQTSLSENILDAPAFMKHGMKWLSAEELATFGANKTLKDFPVN
ncbi:MAG: hypothetical protein KQH63_02520 [Desulfobulbaceae bacterium]|nr:hypothetical protein [Desulfobulbaceae bacterium]